MQPPAIIEEEEEEEEEEEKKKQINMCIKHVSEIFPTKLLDLGNVIRSFRLGLSQHITSTMNSLLQISFF